MYCSPMARRGPAPERDPAGARPPWVAAHVKVAPRPRCGENAIASSGADVIASSGADVMTSSGRLAAGYSMNAEA
jgi:hypothetical protein